MDPTIMTIEVPAQQGVDISSIITAGIGIFLFFLALTLLLIIFTVVVNWKFFEKAGFKGYESLIPVHNFVVMIQIAGKPISYFFLMLIPFANIIYIIKMFHGISKSFGKGAGFTWGLLFLPFIFFPILVWGDSVYGAGEAQPVKPVTTDVVEEETVEMSVVAPMVKPLIVPPVMAQPQQEQSGEPVMTEVVEEEAAEMPAAPMVKPLIVPPVMAQPQQAQSGEPVMTDVIEEETVEMPVTPIVETPSVPPVMEQPQQEPPVPPSM